MNYIYFNEKGRLKKSTIEDLYQSSANVDTIYIFADFDKEETSEYEVSLTFRRSDGLVIGPVECVPDFKPNPLNTEENMRCYSFVLGNDVLDVSGPLQITARYHSTYIDPVTGMEEESIRATAMVVANVNASVPIQGGTSTIVSNLNRRITILNEKVDQNKEEFDVHNHNNMYYKKEESNNKFASMLEIDTSGSIILKSEDGTTLSTIRIPTVIQVQPPGMLVHKGPGMFLMQPNKEYIINIFSPLNIDLYLETGGSDEPISYLKLTNNPGVFPEVIHNMPELSQTGLFVVQVNIDEFLFETVSTTEVYGKVITNNVVTTFTAQGLPFNISLQNRCKIGINSIHQYQVYEV